ncbi:MAG: hypothetical protein Kow0031_10230 [Anaerolineae bacterium]
MKERFAVHWPLALVLALFAALAVAYSINTPLGEAPDEPAHFSYARFIAKNGRLPATLAERAEAGYRSVWPPLYHLLAAAPIAAVGDAPPTRLKAVGDSARRLIPTNGQTIAAFIHTADEAWPWQGITLAWHLTRFISVLLALLSVSVAYAIAWRVTRRRTIAVLAAALFAFNPAMLYLAGTTNDDNLLILLSGLLIFALAGYTRRRSPLTGGQALFLGLLLGLATMAKYNALPLWGVVPLWLAWHSFFVARQQSDPPPSGTRHPRYVTIRAFAKSLAFLLLGAALAAGWWFGFIWRNFNQVESRGLLQGSLAALSAGSSGVSGATLQQLGSGLALSVPPPALWLAWGSTFFKSFWGLFGGSGSIELPGWLYGVLAVGSAMALGAAAHYGLRRRRQVDAATAAIAALLLLLPLAFMLLPLLRFTMSGGVITETAQGRHLFPALPAIALVLGVGVMHLTGGLRFAKLAWLAAPLFLLLAALAALPLIRGAYPPPIPLTTAFSAEAAASSFRAPLAPGIELVRIEAAAAHSGVLPLSLLWQASATPPEDYLIDLRVRDAGTGAEIGAWRGQPVGGRYPTRAWDAGDTLRDDIPVPLLPGAAGDATIAVSLLDAAGQPAAPPVEWPVMLGEASKTVTSLPQHLRADGLPANTPFSYRGTLSFVLPGQSEPPRLVAPDGRAFAPDVFLPGGIALFMVGADWPAGLWQIEPSVADNNAQVAIENRPRRFEPPPLQHRLEANFADRLTLLGYDLPQRRVQPGDSFPLTLHLQARRTMGENLAIFNHLLDAGAVQRGGEDRIPQKYYTTLLWVPGEIVSDSYVVPVDANAPPGVYWLDVGLYPADSPEFSLPLVENGRPIERNSVAIGPIKVGGPPPGVTVAQAAPQKALNINFGDEIALLGYTWAADSAGDGAPRLRLYWQARGQPAADYTVFVHVVGPDGALLAQADGPPAGGAYPTVLWDAGEIIADERPVPLPPVDGALLRVGLYRPDSGERLPVEESPDGSVELDWE